MHSPLAKLLPPPLRSTHLRRSRLVIPASDATGYRLVVVHAPAGFGKTGAMLDLHAAWTLEGIRTAWIQLGPRDNDFPVFLKSLNAAVDLLSQGFEDDTNGQTEDILADTLASRLARLHLPFAIFIDDFETLLNPEASGFLRELVTQMPAHGKLVIGSRVVPSLGLGRLRAQGQLLEIVTDDLRFTPDEAAAYLKEHVKQPLGADDLRKLHARTEGWVTAIRLGVLAIGRSNDPSQFIEAFSGSNAAVADYLAQDVLSQQPPEVRDFLLRTSLLRTFDASLCDAMTSRSDSARLLAQLDDENLFLIRLDASGNTYRYHSLFADFLNARLVLEHDAGEIAALHRIASDWYAEQGQAAPAIEHALRADTQRAMDLLQQYAEPILWQGRVRLLARWFDALPAESLSNRPRLRLVHAWALTFLHRSDKALKLLEGMQEAGDRDAEIAAHMLALHAFILALTDKLDKAFDAWQACARTLSPVHAFPYGIQLNSHACCHIYLGNFDHARRMLDSSRQVHAAIGGGANMRVAHCLDGLIDLTQGRLRQALARYRGAHRPDTGAQRARIDGQEIAGAFLAEALCEAGQHGEAQRLLTAYLPLIRAAAHTDPLIVTFVLLCRCALAESRYEDAMLWLHDCEQMGYRTGQLRMVASARLERSRIALLRGDHEGARSEIAAAEGLNAWSFGGAFVPHANDVDTLDLARWRLAIACGEPAAAAQQLSFALTGALTARRLRRALKLRIVLALALLAAGETERARKECLDAVEYAASEGFVSTFLDEGAPMLHLLNVATEHADSPAGGLVSGAFLQQLVDRLAARHGGDGRQSDAPPSPMAHAVTPEELTRTERKVLVLLADGLSNKAMAGKLFVSEATIKTHLRSINAKLNASSRTHAIAVARKAGLLP
ncbi:LuxR C-terminal-related transcriptional regulator [Paraburkholderia flagellata]|uniref:LuxR C-terminal-related transcriptional regulator n=1 Tax=Paraburkholderia flagellata TaxID=2883241 RepID=UPI001F1CD2BE|nr:LuxR C-terminal-related transcriptional regulator [Paraburkholderia flagellata]